jgi:hypothetical protein
MKGITKQQMKHMKIIMHLEDLIWKVIYLILHSEHVLYVDYKNVTHFNKRFYFFLTNKVILIFFFFFLYYLNLFVNYLCLKIFLYKHGFHIKYEMYDNMSCMYCTVT